MDFIYDNSGRPIALKFSADGGSSFTTYYYVSGRYYDPEISPQD